MNKKKYNNLKSYYNSFSNDELSKEYHKLILEESQFEKNARTRF